MHINYSVFTPRCFRARFTRQLFIYIFIYLSSRSLTPLLTVVNFFLEQWIWTSPFYMLYIFFGLGLQPPRAPWRVSRSRLPPRVFDECAFLLTSNYENFRDTIFNFAYFRVSGEITLLRNYELDFAQKLSSL